MTERRAVAVSRLTRRLADAPKDITEPTADRPVLTALAGDVFLMAGAASPQDARYVAGHTGNQRELALLACWLVADEQVLAASADPATGILALLGDTVTQLADVVSARSVPGDPDRREELARLALRDLGVPVDGESAAESADRLATVDSVRRAEVLRAAKAAEDRTAAVRAAMAEKRAQEAAARYSQV